MRAVVNRPWLLFVLLCTAGVAAACSSSQPVPVGENCSGCITLQSALQTTALPSVGPIGVTGTFAGSGVIIVEDSNKPLLERSPFAILDSIPTLAHAMLYVTFTAHKGPVTLTYVPGLELTLPGVVDGLPTFRTAALLGNVWTTVGKLGVIHGRTVTFAPVLASPPIQLDSGASYRMAVYEGGIVPATPSPTPSPTPTPTPGLMTVTVTCSQSADACANGTTTVHGSVQFYALADTAKLTPNETGKGVTFTLATDTCNKADDPSAGGNWASFSPGVGQGGASFTVTAKKGGTKSNPSKCRAVLTDNNHQSVTIDIGVTPSNVGVH